MRVILKKTAVEFIGSFFLVFTILVASGGLAPFAIAGGIAATFAFLFVNGEG